MGTGMGIGGNQKEDNGVLLFYWPKAERKYGFHQDMVLKTADWGRYWRRNSETLLSEFKASYYSGLDKGTDVPCLTCLAAVQRKKEKLKRQRASFYLFYNHHCYYYSSPCFKKIKEEDQEETCKCEAVDNTRMLFF
jgi:hypothetical protein